MWTVSFFYYFCECVKWSPKFCDNIKISYLSYQSTQDTIIMYKILLFTLANRKRKKIAVNRVDYIWKHIEKWDKFALNYIHASVIFTNMIVSILILIHINSKQRYICFNLNIEYPKQTNNNFVFTYLSSNIQILFDLRGKKGTLKR